MLLGAGGHVPVRQLLAAAIVGSGPFFCVPPWWFELLAACCAERHAVFLLQQQSLLHAVLCCPAIACQRLQQHIYSQHHAPCLHVPQAMHTDAVWESSRLVDGWADGCRAGWRGMNDCWH